MRTRSTVRRLVALATSATLFSGGFTALAATAHAVIPAATVTTMTPTEWDNRSAKAVTVFGSGFANGDSIVFEPYCAIGSHIGTDCLPFTGPEVGSFGAAVSSPVSPIASSVTATVNFAKAPPGYYRVHVEHMDGTPSGVVNGVFKVFGLGGPNVSGIVKGGVGTEPLDPTGFDLDCGTPFDSGCYRGLSRPLDVSGSNLAVGARVEFLRGNAVDPGLQFTYGNGSNDSNNVGNGSGTDGTNDVPPSGNNGDDGNTAYPTASLIQGGYNYTFNDDGTPAFTPGLHTVRITNTDGRSSTNTALTFSQPFFAASGAVSPASLGKGAQAVVLTVNGQGFKPGSKLVVESKNVTGGSGCPADVTMGTSTVTNPAGDGTYNTISAPVTLTDCVKTGTTRTTMLSPRDVTVFGPDGAEFVRPDALQVHDLPTFRSIESEYLTIGQGAHVGFAPGEGVLITGTGFVGDPDFPDAPGGNPAKMTKFDFGPGVTVTTLVVPPSGGTALVAIDVAPDAATGLRTARATNPDGGSKVVTACVEDDTNPPTLCQAGTTDPPTISVGPKIDTITPSSFPKTTPSDVTVTIKGSGFNGAINTSNLTITPAGIDYQAVSAADASTVTFSASTSNASAGPRTLTLENPNDHGRVVCKDCMGIDSLSVVKINGAAAGSPAEIPNTGAATLTVEGTGLHLLTPGSTATLSRQVSLAGQPDIAGTALTPGATDQAAATFDAKDAAPGRYNIKVVKDPGGPGQASWSCTGCVQVNGAGAITVTSVVPSNGGQGATDRLLTFTGTNFAKGMGVSIPGVIVHDVTFASPTSFTAKVDVPADAPAGTSPAITVTSGDGSSPATSTGSRDATKTFTINAAPVVSTISPAALGQGAGTPESGTPQTVTVTGTGFENGLSLSLGTGITVLDYSTVTQGACTPLPIPGCTPGPDSFTAKVQLAQGIPVGKRAATVTNADGGKNKLDDAFTVNAGPTVTSFGTDTGQPVLKRGVKQAVTVVGNFFSTADPKATLAITKTDGTEATFVTVENVAVVSSSKITADVTVTPTAPFGALRIAVTNPRTGNPPVGDGGFGTCSTCVVVADPPGIPGGLKVTGGASSVIATWTAAAANGSPVTNYHVTLQKVGSATVTSVDVPGNTLTRTFTGLVMNAAYTVTVTAANVAGTGPTATATGIAGIVTKLTSAASSRLVTATGAVRFSGKLVTSTGAPVGGKSIRLTFVRTVGSTFTRYATTNSVGGWSYVYAPTYTFSMTTAFLGDSSYRPSSVSKIPVSVRSKVVVSTPSASVVTSRVGTIARVSGYVSPNHKTATVYLYRFVSGKRTLVASTKLTSASTFSFAKNLSRGTWVLKVYIGATKGNLANYSRTITLKRV